jgi:hypothetical protein
LTSLASINVSKNILYHGVKEYGRMPVETEKNMKTPFLNSRLQDKDSKLGSSGYEEERQPFNYCPNIFSITIQV